MPTRWKEPELEQRDVLAENANAQTEPIRHDRRREYFHRGLGSLIPENRESIRIERIDRDLTGESEIRRVVDHDGLQRIRPGQNECNEKRRVQYSRDETPVGLGIEWHGC